VTLPPSGSSATAWNITSSGAGPVVRSAPQERNTGGALCPTAISSSLDSELPSSSVTVIVAVCTPGVEYVCVTLVPNADPPFENVHLYVSSSPSGSSAVADRFVVSGAGPLAGSANAWSWMLLCLPQSASVTTPAATSRPPSRCLRKSASANDAWVWPIAVYQERPPS
jgi:hypothetical protein